MISPRDALIAQLQHLEHLAIAFSGGTDSTLLADIAGEVLGKEHVILLHAVSPLITSRERRFAENYLRTSPLKHIEITFDPMADPLIRSNGPRRCYHCKYAILSQLKKSAEEAGFQHLADGTNHNDRSGGERPGLLALSELGVWSPFADADMTKSEIRRWASERGLPNAYIPEAACLATRIQTSLPLDVTTLLAIDSVEEKLHERGFDLCRVRVKEGDTVVIEVEPLKIVELCELMATEKEFFRTYAFSAIRISADGYSSGKSVVKVD